MLIPYYIKLTLHGIKVLEKKTTSINANLVENDFRIKNINAKERVTFQNEGNSERNLNIGTTELVETKEQS